MLAIGIYRCKWAVLEEAIIDNIRASASAIIILLLIGAIAGSWMVSGGADDDLLRAEDPAPLVLPGRLVCHLCGRGR